MASEPQELGRVSLLLMVMTVSSGHQVVGGGDVGGSGGGRWEGLWSGISQLFL